jgi:hypothetical protein
MSALGHTIVAEVVAFMGSEDVQVNGLDAQNKARLAERIDLAVARLDDPDYAGALDRYAIAVVFTVEASDGDEAYEAITDLLDRRLHDNEESVSTEFATGAYACPTDHDTASTDWDIRGLFWHDQPVERA